MVCVPGSSSELLASLPSSEWVFSFSSAGPPVWFLKGFVRPGESEAAGLSFVFLPAAMPDGKGLWIALGWVESKGRG